MIGVYVEMDNSLYKYKIEGSEEGYYFVLYPNNSNTQAIGRSAVTYESEYDCKNALECFRELVRREPINQMLKFDKLSDTTWSVRLEYEGNTIFIRDILRADGERGCKDWAKRVYENVNAGLQ